MTRSAGAVIAYREDVDGVRPDQLAGFFEGWPDAPSPATHLRILRGSSHVVLAVDPAADRVVGFVTAVSDGVLAAYLPLLEVLPAYRCGGIGGELVRRVLDALGDHYMVDVMCDPEIMPFYQRLGLRPATGASLRRFDRQAGRGR